MKQQVLFGATLCLLSSALVGGQFLQPQSHLGRLMQSISPLVLNQASSYREASEPEPAGPEPIAGYYGQPEAHSSAEGQPPGSAEGEPGADFDAWPAARPAKRPTVGYSREAHQQQQQQQQHYGRQQAALQQAPSQQRGVPQRYQRPATMGADSESAGYDEEPAARGSGTGRSSSRAAAAAGRQQQADSGEQYRMGAYLGPTVDDREINQAFGGSGQDADDDVAPGGAGYGQAGSQGRAQASRQQAASYGPSANSYDDDSAADEDEAEPSSGGGGRNRHNNLHSYHRTGLSSAASQQSRQNRGYGPREQQQQLMAAANGYAPNGYAAGPMDLSGLMAAGLEVYNGDGSYPGYYPQQQMPARQRGGGNRNQAGSMMNPYNGGPYGGGGGGSQQSNADNDNDDQDSDADED